jgi:hypothetical protein
MVIRSTHVGKPGIIVRGRFAGCCRPFSSYALNKYDCAAWKDAHRSTVKGYSRVLLGLLLKDLPAQTLSTMPRCIMHYG